MRPHHSVNVQEPEVWVSSTLIEKRFMPSWVCVREGIVMMSIVEPTGQYQSPNRLNPNIDGVVIYVIRYDKHASYRHVHGVSASFPIGSS